MPLDSLDDWSDLEKPIKPPTAPAQPTDPALEQTWNQASSGGAAAPQADLLQQTGVAGTGASAPAATPQAGTATTPPAPAAPDYSTHVAAVSQASSPQQQAVAHDTLARTLATDLTNDGHEVSWEGAQLLVDGRPYEVVGAQGFLPGDDVTPGPWDPPPPVAPGTPPGPNAGPSNDFPLPPGTSLHDTTTGEDHPIGGAAPSRQQTADNWLAFTTRLSGVQGFDAAAGRSGASAAAAAARGNLQPTVDQFNAEFGTHATVAGPDKIDFGDGFGPVDVVRDSGGGTSGFWYNMPAAGGAPGGGGPGTYRMPEWDPSLPTGPTPWESGDPLPATTPGAAPDYEALWQPHTAAYQPGQIDTNPALPGYDDTLAAAGSYTPGAPLGDMAGGNYTAGTLGPSGLDWDYDSLMAELESGNPVTGDTDALIQRILQHPESMDPRTVAMLKAQSDEEQGQAALSEDAAAKRFGFSNGLSDSNWLASERAATARSADASQIANRRSIDLTAAATNQEDRLKAASLGASYQGQRANQKNAAVGTAGNLSLGKAGEERSRFATTEQTKQAQASTELAKAGEQRGRFTANEQAKQAAAASRQQAVSLAVDTAFKSAAEGRDRFALNENLKQAATKLGIDQDTLTQNYAINTLADLTKRYGIDVGANIDMARLKEQSREFQQDLLVKIQQMKVLAEQWKAQMEQRDREFGSTLGLNYDQLNSNNMNEWWRTAAGGA